MVMFRHCINDVSNFVFFLFLIQELSLRDCYEITCRFRLVLLPFNFLENPLRVCNELRLA